MDNTKQEFEPNTLFKWNGFEAGTAGTGTIPRLSEKYIWMDTHKFGVNLEYYAYETDELWKDLVQKLNDAEGQSAKMIMVQDDKETDLGNYRLIHVSVPISPENALHIVTMNRGKKVIPAQIHLVFGKAL